MHISLIGRIGIFFTSTAMRHGDEETSIASFHTSMLDLSLINVGVHYTARN